MIKGSLNVNKGIWHVSFRIPDGKGGMKQKQLSTGIKDMRGNKRKAEEKMKEILEKWDGIISMDKETAMFHDYVFDWVKRSETRVQISTYDGYVHMFERHIKPYFQNKKIKLADVKPKDLETYYSYKIKSGLSPNTVIKQHAIIRSALQDAFKNGYIKNNPADLAEKPKRVKANHDFYSVEELKKLLEVSDGTDIELPVYLSVMFGLRRSEAVGLRWSAIDFENKTLTVCAKVTRGYKDGKIIDIVSDKLKSEASYSTFALNDEICAYLKNVKEKQSKLIRENNDDIDFVCVNAVGKRLKADFVTYRFAKLLKQNGLRHIRFHDLRHSCISLLVKNNFNMKSIQEYARHADFTLTANTYAHVETAIKKTELDSITTALFSDD
ncbi:MAG: site-specific integrase [Clostridium sp.]|nr:site-specific integrase [Clostridium sp.]